MLETGRFLLSGHFTGYIYVYVDMEEGDGDSGP